MNSTTHTSPSDTFISTMDTGLMASSSTNSMTTTEKKKSKRKKNRSANASGSSTPRTSEMADGPGRKGDEGLLRTALNSSSSRPGSSSGLSPPKAAHKSFADEDEYIAFDLGSEDDEGGQVSFGGGGGVNGSMVNGAALGASPRSKGKERARDGEDEDGEVREDARGIDPFPERDSRKLSRQERRELERKEARSRKRSRSRSPAREWDRGKRKPDRYDYGSTSKAPWIRGLDGLEDCRNVAEMLHREVEAFTTWISPSPIEDEIRGLVAKFPDANVLPFGSYETKLYLPLGDIDLVIMSESMAYSDKVTVLHALANTVKRAGITSRVTIIAKAKVPIVKFVTTHGRFNVDISINQENGLVSGNIINGFLTNLHSSSDSRSTSMALRSLVLITKAFLAQRGMNEVYTGGLGSYSIVWGKSTPDRNLGVLVMEFFELYGCCFNYDEVGISVRGGGTYFSKRQRGWFDFAKRGLLSIEDPADPSNDISKGSYGFHKVKTALAGAHSILTSTAYLRAGIINARRNGQSIHLRNRYETDDLSILSTVMGITQETLNHRRLVQELYDQRTLHKLVGVQPTSHGFSSLSDSRRNQPRDSGGRSRPPPPPPPPPPPKAQPPKRELQIQGAAKRAAPSQEVDELSEEDGYREAGSRLGLNGYGEDDDDEDDAGGRYAIGQPPRKRVRTGNAAQDNHTVFVTDDDEEDGRNSGSEEDEDESRYRHRRDPGREKERLSRDPSREQEEQERNDKRRSYWLSKGIGPGLGGDEYSD
ncbi:hypothetical protein BKA70DRAFT_1306935 [Coprinopsis sp. MPI-PUGE-AT-0042]|nr:hypothetical protein BKA70DRAFT_1306935 [Coprinopsis sp. MPI-PUGE-AT-0042]